MIYEMKTYTNDENVIIQSRTPLGDEGVIVGPITYFAVGVLQFQHPKYGMGQKQFPFPILAATLVEAYEKFSECYEAGKLAAEAELKRELQAREFEENKGLILPNGQRLPSPGKPKTRFQ